MLFGLWFHIQRLTRAAVWPPRRMTLSACSVLAGAAGAAAGRCAATRRDARPRARPELRLDWILLLRAPAGRRHVGRLRLGAGDRASWRCCWRCRSCRSQRAPRWRWSIRTTAAAAGAAWWIAPTPRSRWWIIRTSGWGASWPWSMPTCASAAGSARAPARRRPRFVASSRLATGIDMPQLPVDALRQRAAPGHGRGDRQPPPGGVFVRARCAVGGRQAPDVQSYPCCAPASCRRRLSNTRCAMGRPVWWCSPAEKAAASSAWGSAGPPNAWPGSASRICASPCRPAERVERWLPAGATSCCSAPPGDRLRVRVHGLSDQHENPER
jgi:hypothetical protein